MTAWASTMKPAGEWAAPGLRIFETHTCTEPTGKGSTSSADGSRGCKVIHAYTQPTRKTKRSEPTSRIWPTDPTGTARRSQGKCQNGARVQGSASPRQKQARPCTLRAVPAIHDVCDGRGSGGISSTLMNYAKKPLDIDQPSHGRRSELAKISDRRVNCPERIVVNMILNRVDQFAHTAGGAAADSFSRDLAEPAVPRCR